MSAVVLLPAAGVPDSAHCGQIELTVTSHSELTVEGRRGLLVTFEGLDSLAGMDIVYAKCQIGLSVDSCANGDADALVMPIDEEFLSTTLSGSHEINSSDFRDAEKFASAAVLSHDENSMAEIVMTDIVRRAVSRRQPRLHVAVFSLNQKCALSSATHSRVSSSASGRLLLKSRSR